MICCLHRHAVCVLSSSAYGSRWKTGDTVRSSHLLSSITMYLHQANPAVGQENMLKIVDRAGRICVARPDNTTPIARIAATRLEGAELPVRLYYSQKVFRSIAEGHGQRRASFYRWVPS